MRTIKRKRVVSTRHHYLVPFLGISPGLAGFHIEPIWIPEIASHGRAHAVYAAEKKPRSSRMYLSNCSTDCREPNKTVCRADRTVVTERAIFRAVSVCGSLDLFSTARHQVNGRMLCVIQDYAQRGPSSPGPPTASTLYMGESMRNQNLGAPKRVLIN